MSRCPLCGRKDCCGGYYQEVQDVLVEALEGAKWLIECYVAKPERYEEYQGVIKTIRKRGVRNERRGTEKNSRVACDLVI